MPTLTSFAVLRMANLPTLTLDGARSALAAASNAIAERDETINRLIRKGPYATVTMVQETAAVSDCAATDSPATPADHGSEAVKPAETLLGVG
jgi:hypothetical protein